MNNVQRLFILCPLLFFCLSAIVKGDGKPLMGNADLNINPQDFSSVQTAALQGDKNAAHRLAQYYSFIKSNLEESFFWTNVAAENG